jgi:acyl-CoA synthetase (AMP-forming)/AMP-acid ligase II
MIVPAVDWLARWAHYTPHRLVLRDHASGQEWTYAEAEQRAQALAAHLRDEYGLRKGDRIAVYAHNSPEHVFLFFACVKLGTLLVPLNFRLVPRELEMPLADAEPRLFLPPRAGCRWDNWRPSWTAARPARSRPIHPETWKTWSCCSTPPAPRASPRAP